MKKILPRVRKLITYLCPSAPTASLRLFPVPLVAQHYISSKASARFRCSTREVRSKSREDLAAVASAYPEAQPVVCIAGVICDHQPSKPPTYKVNKIMCVSLHVFKVDPRSGDRGQAFSYV